MALWPIRAGRQGEDENKAPEQGIAIIRWLDMPEESQKELAKETIE